MSSIWLDAGPLIAVDSDQVEMIARLKVSLVTGVELATTAVILAQVWRDPRLQVSLAKFIRSVNVRPVDEQIGRRAGGLMALAATSDACDATLVASAKSGDRILSGDEKDIRKLADASGEAIVVVAG